MKCRYCRENRHHTEEMILISDKQGEDHPLDPQSPYGASKLAGDRLCFAYSQTFPEMNICVVRNFNTFGEYQRDDSYGGVIAKFVKMAFRDEPLTLYGDGTQRRDYMHVKDAVSAYMLARTLEGTYNFGTGKPIGIRWLAERIIRMTGSRSKIVVTKPRRGEVYWLEADIKKARNVGFKPETNFWKDLKKYIEWVRESA